MPSPWLLCAVFSAVVWLQNKRDQVADRSRGSSRHDDPEYRIGRLKHERVKVPRGDDVRKYLVDGLHRCLHAFAGILASNF